MDSGQRNFPHLGSGIPFAGTCWRGSRHEGMEFLPHKPQMPGIFFSSDPRYAEAFGEFVHECGVMLENPHVARESENDSIPSKEWLAEAGHDGLIMVFQNDYFVIAMHAGQVRPIKVIGRDDENDREHDHGQPAPTI